MNATDMRVLGASALTAAAVSLITVAAVGMRDRECRPAATPPASAPATPLAAVPPPTTPGVVAPRSHGDLAILGLQTAEPMGDAVVIAEVMGPVMRTAADASGHAVAPDRETDLGSELKAVTCTAETPPCLTAVGHRLDVDRFVYGKLAAVADGFEIKLSLFDVTAERVVKSGTWVMPANEAEAEGLDLWGKRMIVALLGSDCDAERLKEEGMGRINMGQHAAALTRFEASLRCHRDPYVEQLAFMSACSSQNAPKAKLYYAKLTPAQQTKFAQICIRNNTAYE